MPIRRRFHPRTRRILTIAFVAVFLVLLVLPSQVPAVLGCVPPRQQGGAPAVGEKGTIRIHAPNAPLAALVRRLAPGQDVVDASRGVEGESRGVEGDPAYWKPTAAQIADIQAADLIVLNGAGYEPWAEQAALPRARTVDLSLAVQSRLIAEEGETHSHGPDGEHSHTGTAFTTWLSPEILRAQARALALALIERQPSRREQVEGALQQLDAELAAIGDALKAAAAKQPVWLGSHPVYQYLAQAGATRIDSVHWEPGEMPADTEWTKFRLTRAAAPKPVAVMLWEGEPGEAIRARLDAEGVKVVVLAPLGDPAFAGGDFIAYLRDRVAAMAAAVP
jgi:zinc transport system substrate-binding protein